MVRWVLLLLPLVACEPQIRRERLPRQTSPDLVARTMSPKLGMMVRESEARPAAIECEIGESKPCWDRRRGEVGLSADDSDEQRFRKTCVVGHDGLPRFDRSACNTPLVVSFEANDPVTFTMPASRGLTLAPGRATEWVSARTPWLGRDLDGDGCITTASELFGPPANGTSGFDALRELDGNGDGRIDARDAAFEALLLWADVDQDRRCTPNEVTKLAEAGVDHLSLDAARLPSDEHRSYEGESASIGLSNGKRGRLVDVYLAPMPRDPAGVHAP